MPRKKKTNVPSDSQPATEPKIPKELLDQLITCPPQKNSTWPLKWRCGATVA